MSKLLTSTPHKCLEQKLVVLVPPELFQGDGQSEPTGTAKMHTGIPGVLFCCQQNGK